MSNYDVLKNYQFQFNKNLGQNFIFDGNLLRSIVSDAKVNKLSNVLEIGAGAGTLTQKIADVANKVVTYEIDQNLKPILEENLKDYSHVKVVFKDILKEDMKVIESNFEDNYIVVANLPYYITTPIIFKFLYEATKLESLNIMVQKEVAERICANPGTKNYGALTVLINAMATSTITRIVKKNMFRPVPNVDSAVVRIDFNKNLYSIKKFDVFVKLVNSIFTMRRKTFQNNLKAGFNLNNEQIKEVFYICALEENVRGETLTIEKIVKISNFLAEYLK